MYLHLHIHPDLRKGNEVIWNCLPDTVPAYKRMMLWRNPYLAPGGAPAQPKMATFTYLRIISPSLPTGDPH